MSTKRTLSSLTLLPMLACLLNGNAALAVAPFGEPRSIEVSYADLDLSSPAGTAALYQRIRTAARQVCGPVPLTREVRRLRVFKSCQEGAIAHAVAQVDRPTLTALHQSRVQRMRTS